jgi:hypothetical protein
MISEHAILMYFVQAENSGWALTARGSLVSGWHAIYKGHLRNYDVYLDVNDEWVYAQCPLLRTEPNSNCKEALYEYLLRTNHRMFLGKFTLPTDQRQHAGNWVALMVEYPAEDFDAGIFRLLIEAIETYVEEFSREIEVIALDEEVAALSRLNVEEAERSVTFTGDRS